MEYEQFIQLRKADKIAAGIDNSTAINLIGHLPKEYRFAFLFWAWIWILSILAFILVGLFWKWWIGLVLFVVVIPTMFRAIKKSAAQHVLAHATENPDFFRRLVEKDLLVFQEKP